MKKCKNNRRDRNSKWAIHRETLFVFLSLKKKCSFLFSVFGCLTSMCFYIPCVHCLWKAEEGAQYPGTEETDNYLLSYTCWKCNQSCLQKCQMPLTTETFLQPLSFLLTPAFYVTLTGWSLTIFFRLDLSSQSAICHCLPRAAITSVCDHCCFIFSNMVLDAHTDLIEGTPGEY